ncbi:Eco57I restriction-modification methylase domain-containing protein [Pedobacter alluvionis]|uniref:site-specific DNA-methyltransferase (adenine-specific) n=1 Tax=Pedobacter alluvionis TaxID=475253 RepID=A0A497XVP0_9SPHI|nr:Eco57I restriction-modification methylase domain-containing protein [Pedobacter alluvionis]RLJ72512.1 adenine-specific DNA-methyltransferase [Pedobacter alluvionis]TFB28166.1 methyltransferase [Pedobacter alluvionis]
MSSKTNVFLDERPSSYADKLGLQYTSEVTSAHKKDFGQFFTPNEIADFMSQFCTVNKNRIRILDPGCGVGILSSSLIEYLVSINPEIEEIELTAFEKDLEIISYAKKSLEYLREWLYRKQISFNYFLCVNDFILHNSAVLDGRVTTDEKFDVVISNPPYFKIKKNDPINIAAKSIIHGQQNIYSIFIIISAKLLREGGQLIFISPRSFTSGSYFRLFRNTFFSLVDLNMIHLFGSRTSAFQRDKVLQENVIVVSTRKQSVAQNQLLLPFSKNIKLNISISNGIEDIDLEKSKAYEFTSLVNLESFQKILHLPISINDEKAIKLFKSWSNSLDKSNISISTGPVVAFRTTTFLKETRLKKNVPLIWLNNVSKMTFTWPIMTFKKGKEKSQFIEVSDETKSVLLPNKNYILLRRFSSKDDSSKLIACPYFEDYLKEYPYLGVENHLNYIYRKDGVLTREEVLGLCALLNSKLFDVYFRTFNGNINVSATELREMPLPNLTTIKAIGSKISDNKLHVQNFIDQIVADTFKIKLNDLSND